MSATTETTETTETSAVDEALVGDVLPAPSFARTRMTKADPPPDDLLAILVQWPAKAAEEVLLAPWTIARARIALTELPEKIDELCEALDRTTSTLDTTVQDLAVELIDFKQGLDAFLPTLSTMVTGMDARVERLEDMVRDLGDSVVGVLGVIPGMKRRMQSSARSTKAASTTGAAGRATAADPT